MRDAIGLRHLFLVLDDVWDIDLAETLRCGGPNCFHLLTTRDKGIAREFADAGRVITVPLLEDGPAYTLLCAMAPEACQAHPATAHELAQAVGGLPLALTLLGGYLGAPERSLLPQLSEAALAEVGDPERRLEMATRRLGGVGNKETLQKTLTLSLESLEELPAGKEAVMAFYALAAFAPKPARFSLEAAEAVTGRGVHTLVLLAARNLLELVGEELTLHQTLADVVRARLDEESVARHRDYYLTLVNKDWEDWRRIEGVYEQAKWAWRALPEDEELLDWVWALQLFQKRRGLGQDALQWAQRGLGIAAAKGLQETEGTLLTNIGTVYDSLGQRQEALDFFNRTLPIREEVGDRAGESITRYNIAMIYHGQERFSLAVAELQRVVELDRLVQRPELESDMALLAQVEAELADRRKGADRNRGNVCPEGASLN